MSSQWDSNGQIEPMNTERVERIEKSIEQCIASEYMYRACRDSTEQSMSSQWDSNGQIEPMNTERGERIEKSIEPMGADSDWIETRESSNGQIEPMNRERIESQ
jgi:hypothetical protein